MSRTCLLFSWIVITLLTLAMPARAEVVSETFGTAANRASTHPGKLTIAREGGASVVSVDLSAIPAGTKVHKASLIALRSERGLESREDGWLLPLEVLALDQPGAKPLTLEGPWYRSFDVTPQVAKAVASGARTNNSPPPLGEGQGVKARFLVKQFHAWQPEATELCVTFDGQSVDLPPQVTEVKASHRNGNTFITWKEIDRLVEKEEITIGELAGLRKKVAEQDKTRRVRYRVLRHSAPITAANVGEAAVLAEVAPISCNNNDGGLDHFGHKTEIQNRYVIEDGQSKLPWNTGLYVHSTREKQGTWHYAVASVVNGRANLKNISGANAPAAPCQEAATDYPVPVLQRDDPDSKSLGGVRSGARSRLYVTWNAEPFTNLPNMAYNWCVTIDEKLMAKRAPVGLYLHEWAGTHVRTTWGWPGGRTGILVSGNDFPPQTWWYGWSDALWTSRSWGQSTVHNYTERRVLAFLDWVATQWPVDKNRMFAQGGSMGGSGVYTFTMRHGDRFALVRGNVGIANWSVRGHFTTALEMNCGWQNWTSIPASDAANLAERMNMAKWLIDHPAVETPFLCAGNGKDDGGIGWAQAVTFFKALQESKRPHAVFWGLRGHGTPAPELRIDEKRSQQFRLDQTLPAFTHCSLDNDLGTATKLPEPKQVTIGKEAKKDPFDGDSEGYFNAHLRWETEDDLVVDQPKAWEMTFFLDSSCKAQSCTVDVTPRRLQKFLVRPGQKFAWTVCDAKSEAPMQKGQATADQNGLVTLEKVKVLKSGVRVRLVPGD
jgi:hypothetical protein